MGPDGVRSERHHIQSKSSLYSGDTVEEGPGGFCLLAGAGIDVQRIVGRMAGRRCEFKASIMEGGRAPSGHGRRACELQN